jgi:hypothetical protein|nr:MAG TPA: hypothetical protein [Caudoviricetes sp.]
MGKKLYHILHYEKDKTMTSTELKAYLERVIADLPEQEENIGVDMLLFFRWWDKPYGAGRIAIE